MITLEMIDELRKRMNCTYEEARNALERTNGDIIDAILLIEKGDKSTYETDEREERRDPFNFNFDFGAIQDKTEKFARAMKEQLKSKRPDFKGDFRNARSRNERPYKEAKEEDDSFFNEFCSEDRSFEGDFGFDMKDFYEMGEKFRKSFSKHSLRNEIKKIVKEAIREEKRESENSTFESYYKED